MLFFRCAVDGAPITLRFITGNRAKARYGLLVANHPLGQSPDSTGDWTTAIGAPTGHGQVYQLNVDTANLAAGNSPVRMTADQGGAPLVESTGANSNADGFLLGTALANSSTPLFFFLGA